MRAPSFASVKATTTTSTAVHPAAADAATEAAGASPGVERASRARSGVDSVRVMSVGDVVRAWTPAVIIGAEVMVDSGPQTISPVERCAIHPPR
jgi:hypothetical protein